MDDNLSFVDAESGGNYGSGKDEVSFRGIIMEHLRRIAVAGSVEFHGGYWKTVHIVSGGLTGTEKIYIPNTRDIYVNTIRTFADFLLPHFDKEMFAVEDKLFNEWENRDKTLSDSETELFYVNVHRRLLRELTKFLYRLNYLETSMLED